jgi:hypothetical protein
MRFFLQICHKRQKYNFLVLRIERLGY